MLTLRNNHIHLRYPINNVGIYRPVHIADRHWCMPHATIVGRLYRRHTMHRTKFSPGLLFEKVLYKPDTASFIIRTAVEPIDRGLLIPCVEEASYPIFVFGEIVIANLSRPYIIHGL